MIWSCNHLGVSLWWIVKTLTDNGRRDRTYNHPPQAPGLMNMLAAC